MHFIDSAEFFRLELSFFFFFFFKETHRRHPSPAARNLGKETGGRPDGRPRQRSSRSASGSSEGKGEEDKENGLSSGGFGATVTLHSRNASERGRGDLESENEALRRENDQLKEELVETKDKVSRDGWDLGNARGSHICPSFRQVETLMETVILMEKRISLLEDQVKLSQSLQDLEATTNYNGEESERRN